MERRWGWFVAGIGLGALVASAAALGLGGSPTAPDVPRSPHAAPSPSVIVGERTVVGGIRTVREEVVLPPELLPYPYTTPTPAPVPSAIDGTYIRIVTFEEAGGFRYAIPRRCLRCIPYKLDPGVQTLVLHDGAYYVSHQLSGFESLGHVQVEGNEVTFFNDPNCPTDRGVYRWERRGSELVLTEVHDSCAGGRGRAEDLTLKGWIRVDPCVYRIDGLWPAALGCV